MKSLKEKLAFIDKIDEIPSMPSVVLNLMPKLNDPDVTISEIEKYINIDPALVSYVLKITNSLLFGLREEVYSVRRAVALIGMTNLKSTLTSYSIRLLCRAITHAEAQQYIWGHSVAVAVLAREISIKIFGKEQPQAYVLGLLHDIGKIVLYIHNSTGFLESLESGIAKNMDFVSAEKELFGFSHVEAGYYMTGKMGFSKRMKDVVLFHHDPEFSSDGDNLTWIIALANELAHYLYDNKVIDMRRYLEKVNLSEEAFKEVVDKSQTQVEEYQSIL
jgi:putative nucleotidyltransferase with HDIG domain